MRAATDSREQKGLICGAAAFGGVVSSLFALALDLTQGKRLPNGSYLLGLTILGALGAAVAFFFEETNRRKAFFLGISLPSLIQVGGANMTRADAGSAKQALLLFPVVRAAELAGPAPNRLLKMEADEKVTGYEVIFSSADGRREEKVLVERAPGKAVAVPGYAARFAIQVGSARSVSQPLPAEPEATFGFRLSVRPNTWSGLQRSLGKRDASEYEVVVETVK